MIHSTALRTSVLFAAATLALVLAGCGGGGGSDGSHVLYVDVNTGDDGNPGTEAAPFHSIGRALQDARTAPAREAGTVIRIEPGVYDGCCETFPLVVPSGVVLEKIGLGSSPVVRGGGAIPPAYGSQLTAAVVVETHATIRGLEITNTLGTATPPFHFGVLMVGDEAAVINCSIGGSESGGIRVTAGENILIDSCSIGMHVSGVGLHFAGGGVGGRVVSSVISMNRIGVEYDAPGAALNGEASESTRVQIYGNSDTDVWVAPGIFVNAQGCNWDNVPPQLSTTDVGGGIDIFHLDGSTGIDVTDAGPVVI